MALKSTKLCRCHVFNEIKVGSQRKTKLTMAAKRFPGIDEELQKLLDANMEQAPARRPAREAFKAIQL